MSRLIVPTVLMLAGCAPAGRDDTRALISSQCAACHTVAGVPAARGRVGPSLIGIARRRYIAGTLPNSPATLRRFLEHPQAVQRGGAMPELGLTPQQADAIATYLEVDGGS